jgi:hypothetical protein
MINQDDQWLAVMVDQRHDRFYGPLDRLRLPVHDYP